MEILVGCLMVILLLPLIYAGLAWLVFWCINFLYPLPFLASWGFMHYLAAGFLINFVAGIFKSSVKVNRD